MGFSRKRASSADWVDDNGQQRIRARVVERRISSSIGAVHGGVHAMQQEALQRESAKAVDRPQVHAQPETLNRNKRMFGSLMGHLGLARQKLEQDTPLLEKQSQKLHTVVQKHQQEMARVQVDKKRKADQMLLDRKILGITRATNSWKDALQSTESTITTITEPHLTWLPKQHSQATRALMEKHSQEIALRIAEREEKDQQQIRDFRAQFPSLADSVDSNGLRAEDDSRPETIDATEAVNAEQVVS